MVFRSRKTNLKQNDTSYIAKITQQLLYNSFGSLHKIQNQKQDLKADILKLNLSEFYENYLTTLMHYFYDYYETYINYETAKQNLAESKRLLEDINKRFRANIALENDVALIKVQVLESESAQDKALLAFVNHKFLLENEIGISNFKPKLPSLNIDIKAELADIKK
ncbi:MAG: hypothetical protein OMM_05914 [Candidatus Magnetoglobus multicellularis str. Araruama]|uniref:Outer membrane efflux protein n=1 Tax=Candidatus Magnetoglobus multicellularis str. Araruama TaxID=890399 RepID=A0A1V1NT80_9BACT|nr:MAG: hypothetical protein OMM_05914 [Candidatus Magnetoglobus multicellularis str. Araruama]